MKTNNKLIYIPTIFCKHKKHFQAVFHLWLLQLFLSSNLANFLQSRSLQRCHISIRKTLVKSDFSFRVKLIPQVWPFIYLFIFIFNPYLFTFWKMFYHGFTDHTSNHHWIISIQIYYIFTFISDGQCQS